MANGSTSDQVERVFFEHISFLYPAIIVSAIVFLLAVVAAFVVETWWLAAVGLPAFGYVYFRRKKRNRYIITTKRFIRELYNPHHSVVAAPLVDVVNAKILNRATDKFGNVRVETAPRFGDQLLIDGDREVGVIMCYKIPGHADFRDILVMAADLARQTAPKS